MAPKSTASTTAQLLRDSIGSLYRFLKPTSIFSPHQLGVLGSMDYYDDGQMRDTLGSLYRVTFAGREAVRARATGERVLLPVPLGRQWSSAQFAARGKNAWHSERVHQQQLQLHGHRLVCVSVLMGASFVFYAVLNGVFSVVWYVDGSERCPTDSHAFARTNRRPHHPVL